MSIVGMIARIRLSSGVSLIVVKLRNVSGKARHARITRVRMQLRL